MLFYLAAKANYASTEKRSKTAYEQHTQYSPVFVVAI